MERLLKNVTETDIINFDFIKRNNLTFNYWYIRKCGYIILI